MCFGSAFIASNSSSSFKVKQVFLTLHPEFDTSIKIQPLNPEDFLSADDQKAEGVEESEIITYTQEASLFNTTEYLGKTKAFTMNYNRNMKVEVFKHVDGEQVLLETFILDDLQK